MKVSKILNLLRHSKTFKVIKIFVIVTFNSNVFIIQYNIAVLREVRMIMILKINLNSFQRVIIIPMNLKLKLNSINI